MPCVPITVVAMYHTPQEDTITYLYYIDDIGTDGDPSSSIRETDVKADVQEFES